MNFMVFCSVFYNVSIAYRGVGGMGGGADQARWVGWEVAKNSVRTTQSSHDTNTMAHATLVGHKGSESVQTMYVGQFLLRQRVS